MQNFVVILQIIACILTITLILLQPSKGGSFFTASNQGVFGSSGGTNFLFKATMWCAAFLAISCLVISAMKVRESSESVITDVSSPAAPVSVPTLPTPPEPVPSPTTTPAK